ncbi:hypothetical protein [Dyadobacter sp. CY326]|uniref:hypothetical protein n=1 Tax=Dyadobacter sp. CY326 TaxID=2907300 RepID=UPI001F341057|nr:hypothetical protein [Dyadobacter sp. CY326]MCE7068324.1 hypothetical protein [Dyadobacter sp. CY326]
MKKYILLFLLTCAGLASCKKDSDEQAPGPVQLPNGSNLFLKSLDVTGREKVTFDSTKNYFVVTFPESYTSGSAEVKLALNENVVLIDSLGKPSTASILNYNFRGRDPLTFTLREKEDKYAGYFTVFFNIAGSPKIELIKNEITVNTNGFAFPFRYISGVGSFPSRPDEAMPVLKAINRKTGFETETSLYSKQENVQLQETEKLVGEDQVALELHFKDQPAVVFEGVKFTRGEPFVSIARENKFVYTTKDSLFASGGYFIPSAKYSVRFSSDYLATPVNAAVKYKSPNELVADKLPANIPEGSYLLSFLEGDKVIGKSALYFSATNIKTIESVWKGDLTLALSRNAERLSFKKGESVYMKPSPVEFGSASTKFDKNKLPTLRLKSGSTIVDLKPELAVVNWAIAGVSYPVGKYLLPKDLVSGQYEVMGVFPDKTVSKPYWSKMQVN